MNDNDVPQFDIPRPCPIEWSTMRGEGTARACDRCQRAVHDFSVLSTIQIQALVSDSSKRICARMDQATAQRLGSSQLKALALSTILTTVGVAAAAQSPGVPPISPVSIRGVVHDGDRPLSDVEVRAKPRRGMMLVTRTDERGAYSFNDLKPGPYVISFAGTSAPHNPGSWDVDVEVCRGTTLELDSSTPWKVLGEVVVTRLPPGAVDGRITSQKLDDGLPGATVTLRRPSDGMTRSVRTDTSGHYSFAGLKPERYELTGAAAGFLTRSMNLDVSGNPSDQYLAPGSTPRAPWDIALCPRPAEK